MAAETTAEADRAGGAGGGVAAATTIRCRLRGALPHDIEQLFARCRSYFFEP